MPASGEYPRRGQFGRWIDRLKVGGELAHDPQPLRPMVRLRGGWLSRPRDRQLAGQRGRANRFEVGEQLTQQLPLALEFETQRAAQAQVVGHVVSQRTHRWTPPGHGFASRRS